MAVASDAKIEEAQKEPADGKKDEEITIVQDVKSSEDKKEEPGSEKKNEDQEMTDKKEEDAVDGENKKKDEVAEQ